MDAALLEDVDALLEAMTGRCLDCDADRAAVAVAVAELIERRTDRLWAELDTRDTEHVRAQRDWAIYMLASALVELRELRVEELAGSAVVILEAALRGAGYDRERVERLVSLGPPMLPGMVGQ